MFLRPGLKPEPISIPQPAAPTIGIPLMPSAANHADVPPGAFPPAGSAGSSADERRAAVRQRDFERLSNALSQSNSEIQPEALRTLEVIGHGSSGVVQKVLHAPSNSVLALKVIPVNADEVARKSILLELKTLHESLHRSIVSFYGAFYREGAVHIALEYMDASLLDLMRAQGAPLTEPVLGAIASPVLEGLAYLHRQRHIIHRDIKPSNILVDSSANIKIADFGVSGELSCTISKCASWVGTMHYMSPERITAAPYSYDSDLWSLGITMLELAIGHFPYVRRPAAQQAQRLVFWDLLDYIVESPPPVPPPTFSAEFHSFCAACLQKQPEQRSSAVDLLQHPLLAQRCEGAAAMAAAQLGEWVRDSLRRMPPRGQGSAAAAPPTQGEPTATARQTWEQAAYSNEMETWDGGTPGQGHTLQGQQHAPPPWAAGGDAMMSD